MDSIILEFLKIIMKHINTDIAIILIAILLFLSFKYYIIPMNKKINESLENFEKIIKHLHLNNIDDLDKRSNLIIKTLDNLLKNLEYIDNNLQYIKRMFEDRKLLREKENEKLENNFKELKQNIKNIEDIVNKLLNKIEHEHDLTHFKNDNISNLLHSLDTSLKLIEQKLNNIIYNNKSLL